MCVYVVCVCFCCVVVVANVVLVFAAVWYPEHECAYVHGIRLTMLFVNYGGILKLISK